MEIHDLMSVRAKGHISFVSSDFVSSKCISYLNNCTIIFGNAYDSHIKPVEVAQSKCIIVIANVRKSSHTEPLFKKFGILKLKDIYRLNIASYVYLNRQCFMEPNTSHRYNTKYK